MVCVVSEAFGIGSGFRWWRALGETRCSGCQPRLVGHHHWVITLCTEKQYAKFCLSVSLSLSSFAHFEYLSFARVHTEP